jgi:hypothetical protein
MQLYIPWLALPKSGNATNEITQLPDDQVVIESLIRNLIRDQLMQRQFVIEKYLSTYVQEARKKSIL